MGTLLYTLVRLTVADYARWKRAFDAERDSRQAAGSRGGQVFRSADNPNEVFLLVEWDAEAPAQIGQQEEVRARYLAAGVLDAPEVYLLREIEQLPR